MFKALNIKKKTHGRFRNLDLNVFPFSVNELRDIFWSSIFLFFFYLIYLNILLSHIFLREFITFWPFLTSCSVYTSFNWLNDPFDSFIFCKLLRTELDKKGFIGFYSVEFISELFLSYLSTFSSPILNAVSICFLRMWLTIMPKERFFGCGCF